MTQTRLYQAHYSSASDQRILQTRKALWQAFMTLLAEKPLENITIREIAKAAGVGYNTVFRHYKNKEAMLNDIVSDEVNELLDLCMSVLDSANSLEAAKALCQFVGERDALWSVLLNGGAANTLRETFIQQLREKGGERMTSQKGFSAEVGMRLVAVGTIEMLSWWLESKPRIAVEELAAMYEQLVVTPIVASFKRG